MLHDEHTDVEDATPDGSPRRAPEVGTGNGTGAGDEPGIGAREGRPRRRWGRRAVMAVGVLSLLGNGCWVLSSGSGEVGHWRSREGRDAYVAAYEQALDRLPEPAAVRDVSVTHGTVRAYLFTPDGAPATGDGGGELTPVLLLPGWGSGVPMWEENLPGLLAERPVWAVDTLGDAGLSTQGVPLSSPADQARWVVETMDALGVERAHVVGHSIGGWLALQVALHHPERAASIGLLDPVQSFSSLQWGIYLQSIPASLPFLPRSWRDRALAGIGGADELDRDDPVAAMIAAGSEHYVSKRPFPSRPPADRLERLTVPVYAAMAGHSTVNADPAGAVRFAREVVPDIEIRVWPGASHSLPMEQPAAINRELLHFMAEHEP